MMPNIFDQYLKGQQAATQQGQNAFAMEQFIQKKQRDDQLRNVLSQAYRPELPAGPGVGPVRPGENLPPVQAQAGGFDTNRAIQQMYQSGLGPEALAMQQQQAAARAPERAARLKDQLSRQRQKDYMADFQAMFDQGGMKPGQTAKMTPRGMEFGVDPAAAQAAQLAQQRFEYETGIGPSGVPTGQPPPQGAPSNLSPQMQAELDVFERKKGVARTAKLKTMMPKARASLNTAIDKKKFVKGEIQRAIDLIGPGTTGFGASLASIPATDARSLKAAIEAVKANVAFDFLAEMRQNSPTGGAVGQLSDAEREAMAATVGTLDQALSGEDLTRALQNVDAQLDQSFVRIQNAFDQDFASILQAPTAPKPPTITGAPKTGTTEGGYVFIGGDPADSKNWKKR